jgi:hypothetical protein
MCTTESAMRVLNADDGSSTDSRMIRLAAPHASLGGPRDLVSGHDLFP